LNYTVHSPGRPGLSAWSELTELAGGRIDILVNNAAYLVGQTATTDTTEAMIDTALAVSVKAPILLTAALAAGAGQAC